MNERGTYGSNGAGSYGIQRQSPSPTIVVEVEPDPTQSLLVSAATSFFMTLIGAWAGARVTPENPHKGATIGGATGLFFNLMMDQTFALKRIANRMP